jgi:mono/diheme cytochrome c family protein
VTAAVLIMRHAAALALTAFVVLVPVRNAQADPAADGARLAQRWCASCHVIAANQTGSVPQGPPSVPTIAKSGLGAEQLRAFLSHPHGAMPDLSLTRSEIDGLVAYIQSLH